MEQEAINNFSQRSQKKKSNSNEKKTENRKTIRDQGGEQNTGHP